MFNLIEINPLVIVIFGLVMFWAGHTEGYYTGHEQGRIDEYERKMNEDEH